MQYLPYKNTPIPLLHCLLPFFKFCPPPTPTSVSPPTPTPTVLSVVLFLWLFLWSRHIWCAVLLNGNMDLYMSSLCTLVPEGPWCVFYAIRRQVYWGLTHNVGFTGTLIWYHTHKHTAHAGVSRLTHSYNAYLRHLLCAQSSYLYYIKWLNE